MVLAARWPRLVKGIEPDLFYKLIYSLMGIIGLKLAYDGLSSLLKEFASNLSEKSVKSETIELCCKNNSLQV